MTWNPAIAAFVEVLRREFERRTHLSTSQMYKLIKQALPDLCPDDVPCVHKGRYYGDPEWKHQVRNATKRLKENGEIRPFGGTSWIWVDA